MHWVIPFAGALSPAAAQAAHTLALPQLERLLARLTAGRRDEGDAYSLSPPHERVLAAAWGWPLVDGLLPWAARAAAADGLQVADDGRGWGLLSPTHWLLGTEQVSLANPDELDLDEASARTLFAALQPLFEEDGLSLHWGAATRWYVVHTSLASLPTASLDRVVGRNVDLWLNSHPDARRLRRLQAEAQMLLHTHPLNQARENAGQLPVNSFWLSGTGRPRLATTIATEATEATTTTSTAQAEPVLLNSLRAPALAEDWAAWAEAWATLDAGPLRELLNAAERGQDVQLSLCGERHAQHYSAQPRGLRQRWFGPRRVAAAAVLEAL